MNGEVEKLVRQWLEEDGRHQFLWSDVTRGLVTNRRVRLRRMTNDPHTAVKTALEALQSDGFLTLSTRKGDLGRPATVITLHRKDVSS